MHPPKFSGKPVRPSSRRRPPTAGSKIDRTAGNTSQCAGWQPCAGCQPSQLGVCEPTLLFGRASECQHHLCQIFARWRGLMRFLRCIRTRSHSNRGTVLLPRFACACGWQPFQNFPSGKFSAREPPAVGRPRRVQGIDAPGSSTRHWRVGQCGRPCHRVCDRRSGRRHEHDLALRRRQRHAELREVVPTPKQEFAGPRPDWNEEAPLNTARCFGGGDDPTQPSLSAGSEPFCANGTTTQTTTAGGTQAS
jgi:hypothetical protein